MTLSGFSVAAFYHFAPLESREGLRADLMGLGTRLGVRGTILLAAEGINGTIAGPDEAVVQLLAALRALPGFATMAHKLSRASHMPFGKFKVRLKKEIVTMGITDLDAARDAAETVEPEQWNALITRHDVVTIDTRNDFEVALGSFDGAVDPHTASFSEFPQWLEQNKSALEGKTLAMFCTGGIRCEKATAFAKRLGFADVYHLEGGILAYLERIAPEQSLWRGNCFVFDERVGLGHGLAEMNNPADDNHAPAIASVIPSATKKV
jgi:UPF0176 protein